jgi:putative transposase
MIERDHPKLSIRRQCALIGLNRASFYYEPAGESEENLLLMRLLDEQYTQTPFYGWPRMTAALRRRGYQVNPKRVRRLLGVMGLQAIYPTQNTSRPAPGHQVYPYLLRGYSITRPLQVWSADVTYIRMLHGFMYLVAVIDWYSRYVLAWQLSNTLDGLFCRVALRQALQQGAPVIFNTDQGAQFTAVEFTALLAAAGVRISMDGRGRALDNVFVERLWRTVKYEHIYLVDYATVPVLEAGLQAYFHFYSRHEASRTIVWRGHPARPIVPPVVPYGVTGSWQRLRVKHPGQSTDEATRQPNREERLLLNALQG